MSAQGTILTVRYDDGGFRRLIVTPDGGSILAADGAVPAKVTPAGRDRIAVSIGDDRFLLPIAVTR